MAATTAPTPYARQRPAETLPGRRGVPATIAVRDLSWVDTADGLHAALVGNGPRGPENAAHIAAWTPDRAIAALDVIETAKRRETAEEAVADSAGRTHDVPDRLRDRLESDRAVAIHDLRAALDRWDALR